MPYISPLDVKLDRSNKTKVQPDLLVVCVDEENDNDNAEVQAPDFIMEVMSPSSRRMDMLIKLNKYFSAGVREYWIVDPDEEIVIVYDFDNNNLNIRYTFDDEVPVAISGGELKVDFRLVKKSLEAAERIEKSKPWDMLMR
jgi:Uma2 family endonuclease